MTSLAIVCEQSFRCYSIGREQSRILAFADTGRCQKGIKRGSVTPENSCREVSDHRSDLLECQKGIGGGSSQENSDFSIAMFAENQL